MTKSADVSQKVLNAWAVSLIIWSMYRATFGTELPLWIDEFFAKPFVFLFPAFWYISRVEKAAFLPGFGLKSERVIYDIGIGVGVGLMFLLIGVLVRFVNGNPFSFYFDNGTIIWFFSMMMAGVSEQLLSTGFVFKRLYERANGAIKPILTSAVLFSFLHIPALFGVEKISGNLLLQSLILNFVLSIITSILYVMRKNSIASVIVQVLYFLSLPLMM